MSSLTKIDLLAKYRVEIAEINDEVFKLWARKVLPLAVRITKEEGLTLKEAQMLLDTVLVETIRDMADRHRIAEREADKMLGGGDEE